MIFVSKDIVKHLEYFLEHLSKSISPLDILGKLLQLSRIRHQKLDLIFFIKEYLISIMHDNMYKIKCNEINTTRRMHT